MSCIHTSITFISLLFIRDDHVYHMLEERIIMMIIEIKIKKVIKVILTIMTIVKILIII